MTWPWVSRDRYNRCESQAWYWYLKTRTLEKAFLESEKEVFRLREELRGIESVVDHYDTKCFCPGGGEPDGLNHRPDCPLTISGKGT